MTEYDLGKVVGDAGAKGDKGDTGNGIQSIVLRSTSGKVKTYRITFTDGNTFDYQVTDGSDASVTIVSSWNSTTSNSKVPSEKLTKDSLDAKADTGHTHTISNVTNLQSSLNAKANSSDLGTVATSNSYEDLDDIPSSFTPASHTHAISEVTNLQTSLDAKAPKSHASSATTYGVGTPLNYGHCKTVNSLTQSSYSNGLALSAYQGYVLKGLIDDLNDLIGDAILYINGTGGS